MWNTLAQNLWDDERFDPQLDWVALAMLCTSYKDFLDAMEIVEAEGRICTAKTGAKYQHPAVGMMNKARESYMAGCKHFGLSPFSREK